MNQSVTRISLSATVAFLLFGLAGCGGDSISSNSGSAPLSATESRLVTLEITGMNCTACAVSVRKALEIVPGVQKARVEFDTHSAFVQFGKGHDEQVLIEAVKQAGFGAASKITEKQNVEALAEEKKYLSSSFAEHLGVTVFSDASAYRPGGAFRIAVVIDIGDGWHIYGNPLGPGIGQPTVIFAELPAGFSSATARYALAEKHTQDFGDAESTWVWEHAGKAIHFLSGTVDIGTSLGKYHVEVRVSAQVCKPGSCLPGNVVVPIDLTVSESGDGIQATNVELFKDFDKAVVQSEGV